MMPDDDDYGPYFSPDNAEAIKDIRRALERKDCAEALIILDRFFDDMGEPK